MKKHIKIRGKYLPNEDKVEVIVLERSHANRSFGRNDGEHMWFYGSMGFVSGNIRIYHDIDYPPSIYRPNTENNSNVKKWFLVGGVEKTGKVSLEDWRDIKRAVKEYNEWGDTLN